MELQVVFAFFLALLVLYALVQALYLPARVIILLVYNGVVGGLALWVVNLVGQFIGFHIGLNPVTAITAGLLGVPGLAALILLRTIMP